MQTKNLKQNLQIATIATSCTMLELLIILNN